MKSKLITLAICMVTALSACGHKSGDTQSGGKASTNGTGGAVATPAKSNTDSTLDSPKMPAHVDSVKK